MRTDATISRMARPPRSEVQVWIKRERKRLGLTVEALSARLSALGYSEAKAGTIQIWEAPRGRDPGADNIEGLEKVFESKAPRHKEAASPAGEAAIVAAALERAIGAQTEVIRELLQELRDYRLEQVRFVRAIAEHGRPLEERTPEDDPAPELRGPVPMPAQTR